MMIYERQPHDEVRALARLMMVDEKELLEKAQIVQEGITDLGDMAYNTYYYLMGVLLAKQSGYPLPFEPDFDEEDEEEDEEDGLTEEEERLAMEEDDGESLAIQRAIDKGWW